MLGHVLSNFNSLLSSLEVQKVFKQKALFSEASFSEVTELFCLRFFLLLGYHEVEILVSDNFNVKSYICTEL